MLVTQTLVLLRTAKKLASFDRFEPIVCMSVFWYGVYETLCSEIHHWGLYVRCARLSEFYRRRVPNKRLEKVQTNEYYRDYTDNTADYYSYNSSSRKATAAAAVDIGGGGNHQKRKLKHLC